MFIEYLPCAGYCPGWWMQWKEWSLPSCWTEWHHVIPTAEFRESRELWRPGRQRMLQEGRIQKWT
jgi:hypothetical protein